MPPTRLRPHQDQLGPAGRGRPAQQQADDQQRDGGAALAGWRPDRRTARRSGTGSGCCRPWRARSCRPSRSAAGAGVGSPPRRAPAATSPACTPHRCRAIMRGSGEALGRNSASSRPAKYRRASQARDACAERAVRHSPPGLSRAAPWLAMTGATSWRDLPAEWSPQVETSTAYPPCASDAQRFAGTEIVHASSSSVTFPQCRSNGIASTSADGGAARPDAGGWPYATSRRGGGGADCERAARNCSPECAPGRGCGRSVPEVAPAGEDHRDAGSSRRRSPRRRGPSRRAG